MPAAFAVLGGEQPARKPEGRTVLGKGHIGVQCTNNNFITLKNTYFDDDNSYLRYSIKK